MAEKTKRNVLTPWIIGLIVILAGNVFLGVWMNMGACEAPGLPQFMVLVILPAVYLVLMYLTLKSEK